VTAKKDRNTVITKVETDEGRLLKQEIPEKASSGSGGSASVKAGLYYGVVSAYDAVSSSATVVAEDGTSRVMKNFSPIVLDPNDNVVFAAISATEFVVIGMKPKVVYAGL
jgi:hypothetical protein